MDPDRKLEGVNQECVTSCFMGEGMYEGGGTRRSKSYEVDPKDIDRE